MTRVKQRSQTSHALHFSWNWDIGMKRMSQLVSNVFISGQFNYLLFFFICINCDVFSIQFFLPVLLPIVLCIALLIAANLAVCSVECRQPCVLGTKPQVSLVVIGRNVPLLHLCTPLCCEGLEHLKTCALESLYGLNEQREILSEVSFRIL